MALRAILRRGQITLPLEVRKAAHLEEGDMVECEVTEERILLRPCQNSDALQAWFWTPEWQEGMREAMEDVEAGRLRYHASNEEFLRALDKAKDTERRRGLARLTQMSQDLGLYDEEG